LRFRTDLLALFHFVERVFPAFSACVRESATVKTPNRRRCDDEQRGEGRGQRERHTRGRGTEGGLCCTSAHDQPVSQSPSASGATAFFSLSPGRGRCWCTLWTRWALHWLRLLTAQSVSFVVRSPRCAPLSCAPSMSVTALDDAGCGGRKATEPNCHSGPSARCLHAS
jgi:hypothetical protein